MPDEAKDALPAQLTLLLHGLSPAELYEALLAAGIYAPAVSSIEHVRNRIQEGLGAAYRLSDDDLDNALIGISRSTIKDVSHYLTETGASLRTRYILQIKRGRR